MSTPARVLVSGKGLASALYDSAVPKNEPLTTPEKLTRVLVSLRGLASLFWLPRIAPSLRLVEELQLVMPSIRKEQELMFEGCVIIDGLRKYALDLS